MNNLLSLVQFMEFSTVTAPISGAAVGQRYTMGENWRRHLVESI